MRSLSVTQLGWPAVLLFPFSLQRFHLHFCLPTLPLKAFSHCTVISSPGFAKTQLSQWFPWLTPFASSPWTQHTHLFMSPGEVTVLITERNQGIKKNKKKHEAGTQNLQQHAVTFSSLARNLECLLDQVLEGFSKSGLSEYFLPNKTSN